MTSQLIPVFNGSISNQAALLCNARNLHAFLGVGKRFASWITERIAEYGFVENQDYMIASQIREAKGRGGHNRKEYHLTLDTAKELAMVERNEKVARSAATSSSAKRNFATFSQYKQNHSRNSQPKK